jgi:imidazolonepropionase
LNELGVIQDGSLLVRDGVLIEVGPTRRVENLAEARGAREINAAGRVVMPGFVDSHTHLAFPPPGSAGDDAAAARTVRATNAQRLEIRARGYLEAIARHGATTVEVKTGCGLDESAETKILRVLADLKRDPIDIVPTFFFRMPEAEGAEWPAVEEVLAGLLAKFTRRQLASFADVAWENRPGHAERCGRYLEMARSAGLERKVHADKPACAAAIQAAVEGFAATIDHLEHATPEEARMLAGACTVATLMPAASFHSGGPNAPARALIDAGVAVALATNFNPDHTPTLNMQTVISLACLAMGLTPAEAISAATINGAHALGCGDRTGSLEPGKLADLIILNASDYRELARHLGVNLVHMTMKRGEFIYKEGEVARPSTKAPQAVLQP